YLYYDGLGRTVGIRDMGISGGNGPGRYKCNVYGPLQYVVFPCGEAGDAAWLVYDGHNVGASLSDERWVFLHGGGGDDPMMGLYRTNGATGPSTEYYWITDGTGGHLAAGTWDGSLGGNYPEG